MKIQKIKNFWKKFFASIVLAIFTLGIFTPTTQAVQLFGDDVTYDTSFTLPDVVEKGWNVLYSFEQQADIPFSSLACFDWHDEMWSCTRYAATVTPFFFFSLKEYDVRSHAVTYHFWDLSLVVQIDSNRSFVEWSEYIYFSYYTYQGNWVGWPTNEGAIAKIPKTQCWSKNPDYCFVGFHIYMYMTSWDGWTIYLSSIDMIKYSDENDNMLFYKRDMEKGDPKNFFHQLSVWMGWNSAYWKKLWHIVDWHILASWQNEQDQTVYLVYYDKKFTWKNSMYKNGDDPYIKKDSPLKWLQFVFWLVMKSYEQIKNYDASNTHIRDFLVGENKNLQGNLPVYFGAKGIEAGVVNNNTGDVETDPNVYNDSEFNKTCWSDIWCHIKNLTISIGKFIGSWFKFLLDWLLDILKEFLKWIWEVLKVLYNISPLRPIVDFISWWYEKISDFFKIFEPTINALLIDKSEYNRIVCDKDFNFSIDENIRVETIADYKKYFEWYWQSETGVAFVQNIFTLVRFLNPVQPEQGEYICTYSWLKQVNYHKNSWLDMILIMFFTMWTLYLFFRNRD